MKQLCIVVALATLAVFGVSGQTPNPTADEILRLERASVDALVKKDRAALEKLYANDYSYIHSNGVLQDKTQDIAESMSVELKWKSATLTDTKLRVYGDAAILTGVVTLEGEAKGFVPGARRETNVWAKRDGAWQMVAGSSTIASKDTSATGALSAVKTLQAKTLTPTSADERAVLQADQAYADADRANDDAKQSAMQTKDSTFVSRSGRVPTANDAAPAAIKSMTVAYDRVRAYGSLAVVQGSLHWTDVKGFSPGVLRFMRVWTKDGNAWKLAAEHRTPIAATKATP
jgi:ketosteroid isomerase-like protein